jgi:hypothetical protein
LRAKVIREAIRVLMPGGIFVLISNPNLYFPIDMHYAGLPFVHWLPPELKTMYIRKFQPNGNPDPKFSTGVRRGEIVAALPSNWEVIDVWPAWVSFPRNQQVAEYPRTFFGKLSALAVRRLGRRAIRTVAYFMCRANVALVHCYVIREKRA